MAAKDVPGLRSTALGYVGVDASNLGRDLSTTNPLPRQRVGPTRQARRRSEWPGETWNSSVPSTHQSSSRSTSVQSKPNSPFDASGFLQAYADTFGGDAGGEYTNKDHLWRYYDPTTVSLVSKPMIFKQASKDIVAPNEVFTYKIWLATFGNSPLTNVVLDDTLPSGITYISASPAPTSTSPLRWNLGTVPNGSVRSITLTVKATGKGVLTPTPSAPPVIRQREHAPPIRSRYRPIRFSTRTNR